MKIIQDIILDTASENSFQVIHAKQNDENSRFLKVTMMKNGEALVAPQGSTVVLGVKRVDLQAKNFFGERNEDGTVTVPLPNWMLVYEGKCSCSVSILQNGEKLSSLNFSVIVEIAPVQNNDIVNDKNYDVLVELINEVNDLKGSINKLVEDFFSSDSYEIIFDGGGCDVTLATLDETVLD